MSHKVGMIAQKLDRTRDITAICLLLAMAGILKYSQTFDPVQAIQKDAGDIVIIIDSPINTVQEKKVVAPVAAKIPIAMDPEEEELLDDVASVYTPEQFDLIDQPPVIPFNETKGQESNEIIEFYQVQDKPTIVGGDQALAKHLVHPAMAKRVGTEGKVTIRFVVGRDGVPTQFEIIRETPKDLGFGDAALNALAKVRFNPGIQGDKAVAVRMVLPINFSLK